MLGVSIEVHRHSWGKGVGQDQKSKEVLQIGTVVPLQNLEVEWGEGKEPRTGIAEAGVSTGGSWKLSLYIQHATL